MVSITHVNYDDDGEPRGMELACMAADTKPKKTIGYLSIPNGAMLLEIDTGTLYAYDGEGTAWYAL